MMKKMIQWKKTPTMKKIFLCNICQEFRDGKIVSVLRTTANDIAVIYCPHCGVNSTCYYSPNTIPTDKIIPDGEK